MASSFDLVSFMWGRWLQCTLRLVRMWLEVTAYEIECQAVRPRPACLPVAADPIDLIPNAPADLMIRWLKHNQWKSMSCWVEREVVDQVQWCMTEQSDYASLQQTAISYCWYSNHHVIHSLVFCLIRTIPHQSFRQNLPSFLNHYLVAVLSNLNTQNRGLLVLGFV